MAGQKFAKQIFTSNAMRDGSQAVEAIDRLDHVSEIWGAVDGLRKANDLLGYDHEALHSQLKAVKKNAAMVEVVEGQQHGLEAAGTSVKDPRQQRELQRFLRQQLGD